MLSEDKKFNSIQNFYDNNDIGINQDNKSNNYNKEENYLDKNNTNYFSEIKEGKNNIIKNSITKTSLNKPKKTFHLILTKIYISNSEKKI